MGKILVTGTAGFVGSHLMWEMAARALPIRGISRVARPGTTAIGAYEPETDWSEYLRGVDRVVHLAARAHVLKETAQDPLLEFRRSNVAVTENLAKQAGRAGVRRFILVSSIGVNGNVTAHGKPFTSTDTPNPHSAYALAKAEAEDALKTIALAQGMEFVIIRPPLMYGPGVQANFLKLMKLAARGIPSPFAGVNNRKSFLYVRNLCDLIITVLDHPNAGNRTFLARDGNDVSTDCLYRDLCKALGKRPYSIAFPASLLKSLAVVGGIRETMDQLTENLQIDDTETRDSLNWTPPFTYSEGILATANAFLSKS